VVAVLSLYTRHRHPVEIISHCVWLYHRFPLSYREIEEMMAERGVSVHQLRRDPPPTDTQLGASPIEVPEQLTGVRSSTAVLTDHTRHWRDA